MADVARSLERGAEGVGLYRTEVPFLMRERFPSEEEQRQIYREQLEAFAPSPVTMRTLDIGGDKALPYFPIDEENPFLGWRGIRVTLDHPEILLAQVRAMMKANAGLGNLRILLPMISNVPELEEALALVRRSHRELAEEGFETPMPPDRRDGGGALGRLPGAGPGAARGFPVRGQQRPDAVSAGRGSQQCPRLRPLPCFPPGGPRSPGQVAAGARRGQAGQYLR
jgi:hypothetical protein